MGMVVFEKVVSIAYQEVNRLRKRMKKLIKILIIIAIGTVLCLISFVYVARNGYDDFPILRIYKYLVAFIGVANTIVYVGKREE